MVEALVATPDDPAPYPLLGALYERAGLRQQATSAYQGAQLLMDAGRPSPPAPRSGLGSPAARPVFFSSREGVLF